MVYSPANSSLLTDYDKKLWQLRQGEFHSVLFTRIFYPIQEHFNFFLRLEAGVNGRGSFIYFNVLLCVQITVITSSCFWWSVFDWSHFPKIQAQNNNNICCAKPLTPPSASGGALSSMAITNGTTVPTAAQVFTRTCTAENKFLQRSRK